MRFTFAVLAVFLTSALAAPANEAPESLGLLQPRCLARARKPKLILLYQYLFVLYTNIAGGSEQCLQPAECCSGVCAIDKGCGCQTCL